jgi:predicted HTH domain antitoxin
MKNKKQLLAYANVRDLFENANKYGKGHYLLMQTAIKENRNLVLSLGLKETESDPNLEVIKSKYESGKISVNKAIKMVDKWLYQFVKADKYFN